MQRDIMYHQRYGQRYDQRRDERPAERRKVIFGIMGGVLYLIMALAIMQVAFFVWSGAWQ